MGTVDKNGIWKYDDSDKVNGWVNWMNLATKSTSNTVSGIRSFYQ